MAGEDVTRPTTERNWWDHEATVDERYATLAWGGDGSPEAVVPTIERIMANLVLVARGDVAEVGCGPGRLLRRLAQAQVADSYTGFDISEAMTALSPWPENITVEVCDGRSLNGSAGRFDVIYSVEVFQHLDRDAKEAYVHAIAAALRPGGVAVIQYVDGDDEGVWMCHPIRQREMDVMARSAGLTVKRMKMDRVHDEWRWLVAGK